MQGKQREYFIFKYLWGYRDAEIVFHLVNQGLLYHSCIELLGTVAHHDREVLYLRHTCVMKLLQFFLIVSFFHLTRFFSDISPKDAVESLNYPNERMRLVVKLFFDLQE